MILILDLGSEENPKIAREIRAMGVYTEIHPHDITAQELAALPGVKGIILNGGPNRVVDGVEIDACEREKCVQNLNAVVQKYGVKDVNWDVVCADSLTVDRYDGQMDFVVGNPPYVRVHN